MIIYKCDICKKELKDNAGMTVSRRPRFMQYSLCENCSKPVVKFLQGKGLEKKKKKKKA